VTIVKITVINLKNTFYFKYCKKTFLSTLERGVTVLTLVTVVT